MSRTEQRHYQGVFPVVPTTFTASGELDLPSQLRCVDFMIDAGSDGLCILANFFEQFCLQMRSGRSSRVGLWRMFADGCP
jgi:hypothetical protein